MHPFSIKKYWGQHFLQDLSIAHQMVNSLSLCRSHQATIEIGAGTGVLTKLLVQKKVASLTLVEVDPALVAFLKRTYPALQDRILGMDFLKLAIDKRWQGPVAIIGNFPYNIASQILFKILAHRQQVQEVVGMVQKEVAERLTAQPGCKDYGIPSVLLQAFYTVEYLFTVGPAVFKPCPNVHSAVVRLRRKPINQLDCDETRFFSLVKAGFQQRRKTLRNALKHLQLPTTLLQTGLLAKRAEQLTVNDFIALTQCMD